MSVSINKAKEVIDKIKSMRKGGIVSPHKYIMLLSIIRILDENPNHENRFSFDEIEPVFLSLFNNHFESMPEYTKMLEHPFYYLQGDGFWSLKVLPSQEHRFHHYKNDKKRFTKNRIKETVEYGYFVTDIFELLKKKEVRSFLNMEIQNKLKHSIKNERYDNLETINNADVLKEEKSLFKHEQTAIDIIRNTIEKNNYGKIISNLLLFDKQSNNYLEYDVVLVTQFGVFVVELKHWSGHIEIAPYNWVVNHYSYRNDPHKINSFKSKVLKGIYQNEFRTYPSMYVQSVVVLTNPEATVEGYTTPKAAVEEKNHNPSFASIQDFIDYIKKSNETKKKVLNEQQVDNIVNYFKTLNQPKRDIKYTVPGYETLEYISQRQDCIELIARPVENKVNGLNRFRIFRPPLNASPEEKERFKKRAYNTMSSISQIGEHPNILKVWVIKNEEGDIVEGSEWSETGTLRDIINNSSQAPDVEKSLQICLSITRALNTAHESGVIHRNLRPENVLMFNDIPKLINFDLAYQIEDNRVTVIADASRLKDDGYIAPEILSGQDIDESTDYFNLGIIAYELYTGRKPFSSIRAFNSQGGILSEEASRILANSDAPENVKSVIKQLLIADRSKRLKDANVIFSAFGFEKDSQGLSISSGNLELKPYEQYDLYEIIEKIGEGGEAQIYKAKTLQFNPNIGEDEEKIVALKVFNKEVAREKIYREYGITKAIESAYTVRCERLGYKKNDRYFLVLDYLEGKTLRDYINNGVNPSQDEFLKVAYGIMDAIKAFHNYKVDEETPKPYLHNDIKPDNIVILPDGKPVLIDFGIAGEPRIDSFQGTSDYIPPDSILGVDMKFSQDGDLYSLGVTLWEWVFGEKPYDNPVIGAIPAFPKEAPFKLSEHLKSWFLKAVASEANTRFKNIEEMESAFKPSDKVKDHEFDKEKADESEPHIEEQVDALDEDSLTVKGDYENDFVFYLNSLSNVSAGNENATAESQALSKYFSKIAVRSSLTEYIHNVLLSEKRNVILTGNAGDGKTTIASQIRDKIQSDKQPLADIEELNEVNLIIVKDMSELNTQRRLDIVYQSINDTENRYLFISNSGTLLDTFSQLGKKGVKVQQETVLKALSSSEPSRLLDGQFEVINIGSINSINTACEVFKRMIANENWKKCAQCSLNTDCPMHFNVSLLQAKEEIVTERIALIYRRLYEYYVRLTMRQMVGHLAYSITGGLTCTEIASMSKIELKQSTSKFLFSNLFFGDDGQDASPIAQQLLPVRHVQSVGFGSFLDPLYERKIWINQNKDALIKEKLTEQFLERLSYLFDNVETNSSRRQVRRLLYFYGSMTEKKGRHFLSVFLRSPMLEKYVEYTGKNTKIASLEEKK